ncbi:MAG: LacI family DNA-binding transcriptional regulator [Lentisphaeria bacterium]|nr:LacI family DNA-binding transcriptional regulator [Lentisphaeria bacterium]
MAVTIKDIAKEAGVSFQAVSAVLNDTPGIRVSAEKREQILEIVKRLGYRRNFGYNLMHNKPTNTAAIIISTPFMAQEERNRTLSLQLMERFNDMQIATYFFDRMTQSPEQNLKHIRELIGRGVEAFIFIGCPIGHLEIQKELKKFHRTMVSFDSSGFERNLRHDAYSARKKIISILREKVGEKFKILLQEGSRSPFFLNALQELYPDSDIEDIWQQKVIYMPRISWEGDLAAMLFTNAYTAVEKLLKTAPDIRGFCFSNDAQALGAAAYLTTHGFTVGKDVFVAGFNADLSVRMQTNPIITAALPYSKVVDILIRESYSRESFSDEIKWDVIYGNTMLQSMDKK